MSVEILNADKVCRQIQKYSERLPEKLRTLCERLAEIGINIMHIEFFAAEYDGRKDYKIGEPEWVSDNEMEIVVSGSTVAFIEFGTGIVYADNHPEAERLQMVRGGYGLGHGNQRTWGYYGDPGTNGIVSKETVKGTLVLTHGNPANMPMYKASKEMRMQINEIARSVFAE